MGHRLWFKFHPLAWRGDQALQQVSLAARGLWIELISIMHDCEPYGHLVDKQGRPMGLRTIHNLVRPGKDEDLPDLLGELEAAGVVYFVTKKGDRVIYSKRMVEDFARSISGKKSVEKRWRHHTEKKDKTRPPNRGPNRGPNSQNGPDLIGDLILESESEEERITDSSSDTELSSATLKPVGGTAPRSIFGPVNQKPNEFLAKLRAQERKGDPFWETIESCANGHGVLDKYRRKRPVDEDDDEVPL